MKNIAIIGGGVSGFGSAIKVKESFPHFKVTVYTKDVTPNTTGDGSAGLWTPYCIDNTPEEMIIQWSSETFKFFHQLWKEGIAGASLMPCFDLCSSDENIPVPFWKDVAYGFKELSKQEIELLNKTLPVKIVSAFHYIAFTCEPSLLLPYLMDRFKNAGGNIIRENVESISAFAENGHDVIINCTGLGSKYLVPDDKVFPTRGQVMRVKTPWMYETIFLGDNYIIPNVNTTVLGGTKQKNNFNVNICWRDSANIFNGCSIINPGLKEAEILYEWAGLRPSRSDIVRVERCDIKDRNDRNVIVIHNYGHGGSGVTLFWGCATQVLSILKDALGENCKSKL